MTTKKMTPWPQPLIAHSPDCVMVPLKPLSHAWRNGDKPILVRSYVGDHRYNEMMTIVSWPCHAGRGYFALLLSILRFLILCLHISRCFLSLRWGRALFEPFAYFIIVLLFYHFILLFLVMMLLFWFLVLYID